MTSAGYISSIVIHKTPPQYVTFRNELWSILWVFWGTNHHFSNKNNMHIFYKYFVKCFPGHLSQHQSNYCHESWLKQLIKIPNDKCSIWCSCLYPYGNIFIIRDCMDFNLFLEPVFFIDRIMKVTSDWDFNEKVIYTITGIFQGSFFTKHQKDFVFKLTKTE